MSKRIKEIGKMRIATLSLFYPRHVIGKVMGVSEAQISIILRDEKVLAFREELLEIYREHHRKAVREYAMRETTRVLELGHSPEAGPVALSVSDRPKPPIKALEEKVEFTDQEVEEMIEAANEREEHLAQEEARKNGKDAE